MVEINYFSVYNSVFFCSIFLIGLMFLRHKTHFLETNGTWILRLCLVFAAVRIFVPIDHSYSHNVNSYVWIPHIQNFIRKPFAFGITIGQLIILIWVCGTVVFLLKNIYHSVQSIRIFQSLPITTHAQVARIAQESEFQIAKIQVSPYIDVPRVTGLRKPCIYLPPLQISDEELRMILRHEIQHFKGHDLPIKIAYKILCAVWWWNPVFYIFGTELENILELRCDAAVTAHMTESEQLIYLQAILHTVKQLKRKKDKKHVSFLPDPSSLVQVQRKNFLYQRFSLVTKSHRKFGISQFCALILLCAMFIGSYFIFIVGQSFPPPEDGVYMVSADNAYIIEQADGTLELYVLDEFLMVLDDQKLRHSQIKYLPIYQEGESHK